MHDYKNYVLDDATNEVQWLDESVFIKMLAFGSYYLT